MGLEKSANSLGMKGFLMSHQFLAMDYGAESGRGILITLSDGKIQQEELHRFPNRPVRLGKTLYWDFPFLFAEMLATLKICAARAINLDGIGVDTWGVDFGLLDENGALLSNPVHYRDARTNDIHAYSGKVMSQQAIFEASACEPWAISSLFQLLALQRDNSPILPLAKSFLNIPDLFNYFLTGLKANERSIVSTGNLLGPDNEWAASVIEKFNLPSIFGKLVEPGTVLGPLSESVQQATGLGAIPVIVTAGHDTSAVVAAVPAEGENWAFLSSGTWSIIGQMVKRPITTPEALASGFANEYTLGSWFTCRNILGLWLVQELKRKWDVPGDPMDYTRMTREAAEATSCGALINVADNAFLAPPDMETALHDFIERTGQPKPQSRGQLVRCVLESLALEYAARLEALDAQTGQKTEMLFIVGGGTANKLLCQFTADACGIPVRAGVDQCTALGNALVQAVAIGALDGPQAVRDAMRASFELTPYEPTNPTDWATKREKYYQL
jgi:rhamnulokinase